MISQPSTTEAVERRTVVWIDSERAVLVRWDGSAHLARLESEVPRHRRGGEHVTHDPDLRAMGAPSPEGHRLEHLRRFVHAVAERIDPRDPVEVLGPGTVRLRLVDLLTDEDEGHGRTREVATRAFGPISEARLIARVREAAGDPAPRGRRPGASVGPRGA